MNGKGNNGNSNKWLVTYYTVTKQGSHKTTLYSTNWNHATPVHNPFDHARHYSTEVFEGIRAFWDSARRTLHIMNFEEHIDRLFRSLGALYMLPPIPAKKEVWPDDVIEQLKPYDNIQNLYFDQNKQFVKQQIIENLLANIEAGLITPEKDQIYIRPLITRAGHSDDKLGVHSTTHNIVLEIMVQEWQAYLHNPTLAVYPQGIENPLRRYKCGANYGYGGIAKNWATVELVAQYGKKFDDALLHDPKDNIDEATGANFFVFDDENDLWTPSLTQHILPGTKRETAINIARALGIRVIEDNIKVGNLLKTMIMDERTLRFHSPFLTGTATGIEAIHLLFDPRYNSYRFFQPNEALKEMKAQYTALVHGEEVQQDLRTLQQRVVLDNAVDLSVLPQYR